MHLITFCAMYQQVLTPCENNKFNNDEFYYFYTFGTDCKSYALKRDRLLEFKKSFFRSIDKKNLCIDLVRSINHMLVFDVDCSDDGERLENYVEKLCRFFMSIFSVSHKDLYGLVIFMKNVSKSNLHIYVPEIYVSHDNYELFCRDCKDIFEYDGFRLDINVRNFMMPGCAKESTYKEYKTVLVNRGGYIPLIENEKLRKTLCTSKYSNYLASQLACIQNRSELLLPVYVHEDVRYKVFELYYPEDVVDVPAPIPCFAIFALHKSDIVDQPYRAIVKEKKWSIRDLNTKQNLFYYMKKILHLTHPPITESNTINSWYSDLKKGAKYYKSKVAAEDPLDLCIDRVEEYLANISPKFNVEKPLHIVMKDGRYTMIVIYVIINSFLETEEEDINNPISIAGMIDHIVSRFRNVLPESNILSLNRLKKFQKDVLKSAYGEFNNYSLQYISFCIFYQPMLKKQTYANFMEKGVCNFVCNSAYEDFEFLLHDTQNGKRVETNPAYLITKLCVMVSPIMKNCFDKNMMWNKYTWIEFSEKHLISVLETIFKDLEEVYPEKHFLKSAISTCKNHFLFVKNEINHYFQPDFNYWFLQSKNDMHVMDLLTLTPSPATPQHFCTAKNKAGINFTDIPYDFESKKAMFLSYALDASFIESQKEIYAQHGKLQLPAENFSVGLEFIYVIANFDPEIVKILFWLIGYFMIGSNPSKLIVWLWGSNDNGKTAFINVLNEIFGTYRGVIDESTVSSQGNKTNHKSDIDSAINKRIAHAEELQCNLNDAYLKDLSGNGTITFRAIYENFKEARPLFTLLFTINESPLCKKATDALIARFKVIKFLSIFKNEYNSKSFSWMTENGKYAPKTWNYFQCGVHAIYLISLAMLDHYIMPDGHMRLEKHMYEEDWKNEFIKNMNLFQRFVIECDLQTLEGNRLYMSQVQTKIRNFCTKNKIQEYCGKLEEAFKETYKDLLEEECVVQAQESSEDEDDKVQTAFLKKLLAKKQNTRKRKLREVWFRDLVFGDDAKNMNI